MLEIIKPGTNFDFIGFRRIAYAISLAMIVGSLVAVALRGLNYGIDFAGGTTVHVRFRDPVEIGRVREAIGKAAIRDITVQDFGGARNEFLVRVPEADPELKKGLAENVEKALREEFGSEGAYQVLRVESVGPRVGKDLRRRAILAVLASTVMMGIYITLRFELRFGIGAAAALFHDVIITVGALSLFAYEFDLNTVAALLTVVGFSVNDTVIVSDRIRENLRKSRREALPLVMNRSINETLSRTVLTNGTALFVVIALFLLGGDIIHGFAFALLVGFTVGTYSSIFVVVPIVLGMERRGALTKARAA
jgi:preprotein translocase subunit SecF